MSLSLGWLVVMLLIGIGVLVFAGAYLDGVTDVLEQSFGRSFLVGIAGELGVIPAMVLICAGLAVTVVGILLIPFAIVAYVVAVAGFLTLGFLSVARLAGGSIGGTRGEAKGRALRGLVLGITMFMGAWVLAAGVPVVTRDERRLPDDRVGAYVGCRDRGLRRRHPLPRRHASRCGEETGCR
jgi:hypothetical protein